MRLPKKEYRAVSNFARHAVTPQKELKLIRDARKTLYRPNLPELKGSYTPFTEKKLKRNPNFKPIPLKSVRIKVKDILEQRKLDQLRRTNGGLGNTFLGVVDHFPKARKKSQKARKIQKSSRISSPMRFKY